MKVLKMGTFKNEMFASLRVPKAEAEETGKPCSEIVLACCTGLACQVTAAMHSRSIT